MLGALDKSVPAPGTFSPHIAVGVALLERLDRRQAGLGKSLQGIQFVFFKLLNFFLAFRATLTKCHVAVGPRIQVLWLAECSVEH